METKFIQFNSQIKNICKYPLYINQKNRVDYLSNNPNNPTTPHVVTYSEGGMKGGFRSFSDTGISSKGVDILFAQVPDIQNGTTVLCTNDYKTFIKMEYICPTVITNETTCHDFAAIYTIDNFNKINI